MSKSKVSKQELLIQDNSLLRSSIFGKVALFITVIAVCMTLFHLYTSIFGVLLSIRHRSIHVGFALCLAFLLYAISRTKKNDGIGIFDWILFVITVLVFGYIAYTANDIAERFTFVEPLSNMQLLVGTLALLLLIEASRRVVGMAFVSILLVVIVYVYIGPYLPSTFAHKGFPYQWMVEHLVYTTEGIFGTPTGVSATYVFIFILFGAFLDKTGAGDKLINLAFSLVGKQRGGPAKTAVVASGFFGMITGSAVGNVVTTGTFTIPMMKRIGYKSHFAGGVESVASSGGQITPPLMGATAFLIAEFVGVPYLNIAAAAAIPAILYYCALLLQVHLRALKENISGMPEQNLPKRLSSFLESVPYLLSVAAIVYFLALGYTPLRAGLFAIFFVVAMNILVSLINRVRPISISKIIDAMDTGARNTITVAVICSAAGIVIGVISMTGIGLRVSSIILDLAGDSLFLTMLITMVTSLILGMGLPTIGAYIIQVALTVPALVEMGVPTLAAHLFVFYFAALSAITPPVAVAAYAASGIAGSDPMRTGFAAFRLAMAGFIIPFMFVYGPSLILIGSPLEILLNSVTAVIGVTALAIGIEGYLFERINWAERILFFVSAGFLMHAEFLTDAFGLGTLLFATILQLRKKEKKQV